MASDPPQDDDPVPDDPESRFLITLWDRLDKAAEISVNADVMDHLGEILGFCEEAARLIRDWRDARR